MKNQKLAAMKKKTFLERLRACTVGGISDLSTPLIFAGLMATGAAVVGSSTNKSVGTASETIGGRANRGASGNAPTPGGK